VALAVWDWNESYPVCATHQALAKQTAENLQRTVSFSTIAQPEQPLTRSERAKLKGEVYALEMEVVDLKARGVNLYNENTALTRQVQSRTVRLQETEAQLKDAQQLVEQLQAKLEERDAEHGNLVDEVSRLRTLSKFTETNEDRHRVGLEG
jgi:chromosome segregation ATPase